MSGHVVEPHRGITHTPDIYVTAPSSSSSYKKRFTSSWARKRISSDDNEGTRDSLGLGLRLLHYSPDPLIDLVFVHGLRGGSTKTWRKGDDPRNFWPKLWLPVEAGLQNANIHSFGYDSDWASTKSSILNVHDFGQSLLEEMRNSPYLRENGNGPIILVGHSMGGLVVKKAFILARDVPEFQERIRCIFFLATPHRGSDYAAVLNNILSISTVLSSRHYVNDLTTGSTSAQLINEDFGRYASDLPIFSFYETLHMKLGIFSTLIVEKNSAILGPGFPRERVQYINANHRDICKFESPDDPNYVTLKNALTSATQDILKDVFKTKMLASREQQTVLQSFLGISDRFNEHYTRVEGSCQWIDARDDFQDWRDPAGELIEDEASAPGKNPAIFWVYANPGTGKSHLAAHIVDELGQFHLECASYFFHAGTKSSRSLGDFLRSIAYQMALSNTSIRKKLVRVCQEKSTFDKDDAAIIWTKIFKRGIFQARIRTAQYWVIDAMDECGKYREFFTLIKGIQLSFPLRIFITSRKIPDMQRMYRPLESSTSITCIEIPVTASTGDIKCYIQDRVKNLTDDFVGGKDAIARKLLLKSNGCFLWVRLVLDELEKVYTKESITQILENIPEGMVPYYKRTIGAMAENRLEKHVAKSVLLWVVASSRSLVISELSNALELDINTVLPSAKSAVEGLCGQLVFVDQESGLVNLVHPTAREFLLSETAGEFFISKPQAHERIALACLQLLSSAEMMPPRNRRTLSQQPKKQEPSPLLEYAVFQFSEHIYTSSAETDEVLLALDHFFRTNILSWIEKIAQNGDIQPLIRVSKNLKSYLDRRAKYRSPLSGQVKNVDGWSIDLSRIVTKFGAALLHDPSSIYFIIPPFCPSSSAIYQQFAKRPGPSRLSVVGHTEAVWDDCIASVSFGEDSIAAAVSCGENLIAVGMESGDINLFNSKSCQKEGMLQQKHPIDLVHFMEGSIALCTTRSIVLVDRGGRMIWETRLRFRCILLTSSDNVIIAVSQHGHVLQWDIKTGALLKDQAFAYTRPDDDGDENPTVKAPDVASLSPDMETIALGYRLGSVCLFEVDSGEAFAWPHDKDNRLAPVLLFNPNPNISLLLIIYTDHELAIYESDTGELVHTQSTSSNASVQSASCSPAGRTLATVDTHGILQIWDFKSLNLLYHVLSPSASFRILNFLSDGSGMIDVVDSGMRIWTPATLVRKNIEDDQSVSDDMVHLAATEGEYETLRVSKITAMCPYPSRSVIYAGKHDGQIIAFDGKTGQPTGILYAHSHGAFITGLAVSKNGIIASSDVNCVVQVWNLNPGTHPPSHLHTYSTGKVKQLCFSSQGDYLLVATGHSDHLYSMKDGSCVGSLQFEPHERKIWRWFEVPGSEEQPEQLTLLHNHTLTTFSTHAFPSKIEEPELHLHYELEGGSEEVAIDSATISLETQTLILDVRHTSGYVSSSTMFLFDLTKIVPLTSPLSDLLPKYCRHFIGLSKRARRIVFLHQNSWLCSVDLASLALGRYTQHFFVPNEYVSMSHEVLPLLSGDDVVFCLHGRLVVVRNGLTFQDVRGLE